jgi:hypothetical protein
MQNWEYQIFLMNHFFGEIVTINLGGNLQVAAGRRAEQQLAKVGPAGSLQGKGKKKARGENF